MSTWVERVEAEKAALADNIAKLLAFIQTDGFKELARTQQVLLQIQVEIMLTYQNILYLRLMNQ